MPTDLEQEREAFERGWVEWGSNKWASKSEKSAAWSAWRARSRAALAAPAARQEHDWKAMAEAARRIGLTFLRDDDGRYTLRQLGEVRAQNSAPQEQPSDKEAAAFADQHGMYYDTDPTIAGKHARALLTRYGAAPTYTLGGSKAEYTRVFNMGRASAAPQGGEDAEPVAKIFHPAPCKGLNCGSTDGRTHSAECEAQHAAAIAGGTFIPSNLATPQPAGRDARDVPDVSGAERCDECDRGTFGLSGGQKWCCYCGAKLKGTPWLSAQGENNHD